MELLAVGWLILELTDSPLMVGVATAVRLVPFLIVGIPAGAVADRIDRRLFLLLATVLSVVVSLIMTILIFSGEVQVWQVMLLALAGGVSWATTTTVRLSFIYDIVGHRDALNGLSLGSLGQRFGGIMGGVAAGFLVENVGMEGAYVAITACYALSSVVLVPIRDVGQAAPQNREGVLRNIVGTFQAIRSNRVLPYFMLLTAAIEVLGFSHQSVLPVMARDVLGIGAGGLGIMMSIYSAGSTLGVLFLATLGDYRKKGFLMLVGLVAFGLGLVAFSQVKVIALAFLTLGIVNFAAGVAGVLGQALMQANVPNEQRGRAMGAWSLAVGMAPAGHMGIGTIAGILGAPAALLINGLALAVITIGASIKAPFIRKLE